ncbi:lysostaphin resistance A-like protein [Bacteroidota bacterium]
MNKNNKIWWYLGVVFVISYIWQYTIYCTGGIESPLFPIMMIFPAVIAVIFRLVKKEGFKTVGWKLKKWWYIFPAIFIPIAIVLGTVYILEIFNWGTWSEQIFVFKDGMLESSKIDLLLGREIQSIAFFVLNFIVSHIVFLIGGSIFTFGEEFGWRGYAQEKLINKFGLNKGLILLGIIWGYWHLPIILMGYNFPEYPILGGLLLMPVMTIFLGIFFGWIYIRSGSIWIPVLVHTVINTMAQLFYGGMTINQPVNLGILLFIAWGIVAGLCLYSLNKNKVNIKLATS